MVKGGNETSYLVVSAKASFRDITCEIDPGSPLPFLFFVEARGDSKRAGGSKIELVSEIMS